VAFEQNANRFSTGSRNQSTLDGLFGHQPHRPAGAPLGRIRADHGDDALALLGVEQARCAGPLFVIERAFEPALLIAPGDVANRLPGQRQHGRDLRCADSFSEPLQSDRAHGDTDLLDSAGQHLLQHGLIFGRNFHTQGGTGHTPSMAQNISSPICLFVEYSGGHRTRCLR